MRWSDGADAYCGCGEVRYTGVGVKLRVRLLSIALSVTLCAGVITAAGGAVETAQAADAGLFDPGYIISDQAFYDANAMSVDQIQSFLNSQVPNCQASTGPTCLKNYVTSSSSKAAASGRCAAYPGSSSQSAASIIWGVGQACSISPKVLLVLLQKEQGLVTSKAPSATQYRIATGYGCPDTAACDTNYYGFFNQLYAAAKQFKTYAATASQWSIKAGQTNNIRLHPNAACGTKPVFVRNQATASLYIYTPYTPNGAAMANLYGTGDACSSYGNRNFWRTYSDWFGSPTGDGSPYGALISATAGYNRATVSGWTVDPDSSNNPISAVVYVDGTPRTTIVANKAVPELASRLGEGNTLHGFATTVSGLSGGSHSVCFFGINVGPGSNTLINCTEVTVLAGNPIGTIDQAAGYAGTIYARGWTVDPDTDQPIGVKLVVDSKVVAQGLANGDKPGLDAALPGYGDKHAFTVTANGFAPGAHSVCIVSTNTGPGGDTTVACRNVQLLGGSPILNLDEVAAHAPGQVTVRGWAIDPDVVDPTTVELTVDGRAAKSLSANTVKESLGTAYFGYGPAHSFSIILTGLAVADHTVCVTAKNFSAGADTSRCSTAPTPTGSPVLRIDQAEGTGLDALTVRGWAIDPDVIDPVRVHIYVDGILATKVTADTSKAGLDGAFPGYGDGHSFFASAVGIRPGNHNVCEYAINVGGGSTVVECRSVAAYSGNPVILFDEVAQQADKSIKMRGWAIDPDDVAPIRVHLYVDGVLATKVTADGSKPSLGTAFPSFGPNHAYSATVPALTPGTHEICAYGINAGPGGTSVVCSSLSTS